MVVNLFVQHFTSVFISASGFTIFKRYLYRLISQRYDYPVQEQIGFLYKFVQVALKEGKFLQHYLPLIIGWLAKCLLFGNSHL